MNKMSKVCENCDGLDLCDYTDVSCEATIKCANVIYNKALQDFRFAIEDRITEKNRGLYLIEAYAIEESLKRGVSDDRVED